MSCPFPLFWEDRTGQIEEGTSISSPHCDHVPRDREALHGLFSPWESLLRSLEGLRNVFPVYWSWEPFLKLGWAMTNQAAPHLWRECCDALLEGRASAWPCPGFRESWEHSLKQRQDMIKPTASHPWGQCCDGTKLMTCPEVLSNILVCLSVVRWNLLPINGLNMVQILITK